MDLPQSKPRLMVVCGLPGSGKTTLARRLEKELHAVRFCPDEWLTALAVDLHDEAARDRVEKLQWKLAQDLLLLGLTVIIEWGTWGRWERDLLREGARAVNAPAELHYLSAPEELLFERIRRRKMEDPPISRETVARWQQTFETPTAGEMALFAAAYTYVADPGGFAADSTSDPVREPIR